MMRDRLERAEQCSTYRTSRLCESHAPTGWQASLGGDVCHHWNSISLTCRWPTSTGKALLPSRLLKSLRAVTSSTTFFSFLICFCAACCSATRSFSGAGCLSPCLLCSCCCCRISLAVVVLASCSEIELRLIFDCEAILVQPPRSVLHGFLLVSSFNLVHDFFNVLYKRRVDDLFGDTLRDFFWKKKMLFRKAIDPWTSCDYVLWK